MSKKKAFSGSTMTLKDFHGGSIPSDLPLPSAPGMTVERSSHDRPNSGGWMGSSINRGYGGERGGFLRQGSANGSRTFEDKALYFPNPANIGRHYDEDERKPVDSHNRRGQGVESFEEQIYEQRQTAYERPPDRYSLDNRGNYNSSKYLDTRTDGYVHEEFGLIPVGPPKPQLQDHYHRSQATATYAQDSLPPQEHPCYYQSQHMKSGAEQLQETTPWRLNIGSPQQPSGSGVQNVWAARREGELNRNYSAELAANDLVGTGRAQAAASRIAQASALEKVSSGRWNSRISPPAVEQPREPVAEYMQPQGRFYGGGRGVPSGSDPVNDIVEGQYTSDLSQGVYEDTIRSSYNEHARSGYAECGSAIHSASSRVSPLDMGQRSFLDTRREQYGEVRGKTLLEASNDLTDHRARYLEPGRGSLSDPELGSRYTEDYTRHGYGEIGWRANAGHRDSPRNVWPEGGAYVEPGPPASLRDSARFGGNEGGSYVEPSYSSQSNPGWMVVGAPTRGAYVDGTTGIHGDASRSSVSDSGRRVFSSIDRRMDSETGHSSYPRNDGTGSYHSEGRRGAYSEGGHGAYGYHDEGGQQSHGYISGRDYIPPEAPKSPYVSDVPKAAYVNERNKGTFAVDLDRGLPMEGGRFQTPRGARNPSFSESVGPVSPLTPGVSLEPEGKSVPNERPKLKLLPRTKPLEVESGNGSVQHGGSGDMQGELDMSQASGAISSEFPAAVVPASAAVNISAGAGLNDNEEDTNRPMERPKLNLKPRSQPAEVVPESGSVKERMSVFGGARPRELVLKDRGVDESVIVGVDHAPSPSAQVSGLRPSSVGQWVNDGEQEKQDKIEEQKLDGRGLEHYEGGNSRRLDKHGSGQLERNESRGRKESWFDQERKENRQAEYQHLQERRESDRLDVDKQDSWRRPSENLSSSFGPRSPMSVGGTGQHSSRGPGLRGASSAAELAHAFSRSTSLGAGSGGAARGIPSQSSPIPRSPGPGFGLGYESSGSYGTSPKDIPFSRLTEAPMPGLRDVYASGVHSGGHRRMTGY